MALDPFSRATGAGTLISLNFNDYGTLIEGARLVLKVPNGINHKEIVYPPVLQ